MYGLLPISATVLCLHSLLGASMVLEPASAFAPAQQGVHSKNIAASAARAKKAEEDEGYRFGDISRGIAKRFTKNVEKITGEEYKFGALSRHIDAKAKEKVCEITGKESYAFGDISRWADASVKARVCEITGKESYSPGDLSKEIVRRALSGEMKWEEVLMLMKMLLSLGASFSPVAGVLPAKILIELLNYSILAQAGEMVTSAISTELDRRMKKAITGDEEYALGDITKRKILDFVGSDTYEFGSITKTILAKMNAAEDGGDNSSRGNESSSSSVLFADSTDENLELNNERVLEELAAWDKAFQVEAEGGGRGGREYR